MTQPTEETTDLVAQKCAQIDMLQDKLDTLDLLIERGTAFCKKAYPVTRLILGEYEEPSKKGKCAENEDKSYHGS